MPLVCLFFAVWCGKSNKIKAFQKESANLFILYIGSNPSGEKKKKAAWQEGPNQGIEN